MFTNTSTHDKSHFYLAVSQMIDAMCDAMRSLPGTDENIELRDNLKNIKSLLVHDNDQDNAILLFQGFNDLIETRQNVTALIFIIKHFEQKLTSTNLIRLTIKNLSQNNQELQTLFGKFLETCATFKVSTEEAKNISNKFTTRLKKQVMKKESYGTASSSISRKDDNNDAKTEFGWRQSQTAGDDAETQAGWQQSQAAGDDAKTQAGWQQSQAADNDAKTELGWHQQSLPPTPTTKFKMWQEKLPNEEEEMTEEMQTKTLADQILSRFMVIAVILNTPEFRNILELPKKFKVNDFITSLITAIDNYKKSWLSVNSENLQEKKIEISTQTKQLISSTFNTKDVGIQLRSLILLIIIKIPNEHPPLWLTNLQKDLKDFNGFSSNACLQWIEAYNIESKGNNYYQIIKRVNEFLNDLKKLKDNFEKLSSDMITLKKEKYNEKTSLIEKAGDQNQLEDNQQSCCSCCNIL